MNAHNKPAAKSPRCHSKRTGCPSRPFSRLIAGSTVVEAIGVLSILTIVGSVVAPAVHQQVRDAEQKSEAKTATTIVRAIETVVLERKMLPGTVDWIDWVAPELDQPVQRIANSRSGCQRMLVYHPACAIQPGESCKTQTASGFTGISRGVDRLMVVSTLQDGFPEGLNLKSAEAFEALWNTEPHQRPAGWSEEDLPDPDDLQIARLDLGRLIHRVVVNNMSGGDDNPAKISLEDNGTVLSIARGSSSRSWERGFVHGTGVNLHGPDDSLMGRELINSDRTLYYGDAGWGGPALPGTPAWGSGLASVVQDFLDAEFPCVEEDDWQQAAIDELYRELWAYVDWAETGFVQGEDGTVAPAVQLTRATLDRLNEGTLVLLCPDVTQTATVTFSLLSSEAGYLNEATLFVNGVSYDFGNSDMGAGFSFDVDIEVSPFAANRFDLVINTWKRHGDWIPGLDTRNGQGFELIGADDSWGGRSDSVAKIKDLSPDGQLHMAVGYEDLIMTGDRPDWDYNDFVFEFWADQAFEFSFGYDLYGGY